ncbi:MAG: hypothetical protein U5K31_14195 [Balneolaceae bacterium]|nr:hypothetical protein [Balneolaceae bacterium]
MSNRSISKGEALELITPVIDGEVSEETRDAFLRFIENNQEVRRQYQSQKKIKELIVTRCPFCQAPESLRERVRELAAGSSPSETSGPDIDDERLDHPSHIETSNDKQDAKYFRWPLAAAASLLLVVALWGMLSWYGASEQQSYNVEQYVYQHFTNHGGGHVPPTISAASLSGAELSLSDSYNLSMDVPPIEGTEFAGVVYSEFVPGYETPMLEYYQPSVDQYIYVFAFSIDSLDRFRSLTRTQAAVENCKTQKDYHVLEIEGKHVVTWKWEDTWYAAISNHDGNTLASLVGPLQK